MGLAISKQPAHEGSRNRRPSCSSGCSIGIVLLIWSMPQREHLCASSWPCEPRND